MKDSDQTGKRKKKITEVKTFPVKYALGEIKESISISTNRESMPYEEELINQAFRYHSQGNISEAKNIINFSSNKASKIIEFFLIMDQF